MARKPVTDLSAWPSLTLEGNLIAPAMVAKVGIPKYDEETRQSYRIRKGLSIRDEISTAFRVGQSHFDSFWKLQNPSADATRRFMRDFLAETLGFDDITPHEGAVSLLAGGRVPIVVVPPDEEKLDRKSPSLSTDRSRSAAFALQDYLNDEDEALWGLATNGTVLRLMRDNASLTRPAFIEADLAQIFTNEDAASLSILWLLFHRTRFGIEGAPATDCELEGWRDAGAKEGVVSRDRLAGQVKLALKILGSGFLEANPDLATKVASGDFDRLEFKNELLRLIYRLIFLMVAEDRNLLHPAKAPASARKLFAEGYSLSALRTLCTRGATWDRHQDRYEGIKIVFRALSSGEEALALPALGGLFGADELPHLGTARLRNRAFMEAIYHLSWLTDKSGMVPVNWRSMETEELGSVYESLLELQPQLGEDGRSFVFAENNSEKKGNQRKTTGSYYTPDSLVQALLDTALDPVLDQTEAESPDPAKALLKLSIIDPACGSGHFLLAAARRIATRLARIRAEGTPSTEDFRHALRDVARCCIHGVDRNPMAVELTKVALWIETVDPGLPLGFFDAQIRCGDALLGIFDLKVLQDGIPAAAYKPLIGDDKETAKYYAQANKGAKGGQGELNLGGSGWHMPDTKPLAADFSGFRDLPEETVEQISTKAKRFKTLRKGQGFLRTKTACDLYLAAFLLPKTGGAPTDPSKRTVPTTEELWLALNQGKIRPAMEAAPDAARRASVLHWPLEFPDVMQRGGFDVVLGNPPWERIKLQEQEFFASRVPEIVEAKNKAERSIRIKWLSEGSLRYHLSKFQSPPPPDQNEVQLFQEFEFEKRLAEATSVFVRVPGDDGGRYVFTGRGDVNTYALFAEHFANLARLRAGVIVPTGIATDATTAPFFAHLVENNRLARLVDFENRAGLFPAVDSRMKFSLITLGRNESEANFAFFLTEPGQLAELERNFTLTAETIARLNPNTRTAPVFRSRADAALTAKIYSTAPVLIEDAKSNDGNPWGFDYMTKMFDMADSSHLFSTSSQLADKGFQRIGSDWFDLGVNPENRFVPLFEAKMTHHFDHRWAGYAENGQDLVDYNMVQKASPTFDSNPRYWIEAKLLRKRTETKDWNRLWLTGWRDITNATNERTLIASTVPEVAVNHKIRLFFVSHSPELHQCLLANFNSLVTDYVARQMVGGTALAVFVLVQLPILPPSFYTVPRLDFIVLRVLELTYTSNSLAPFAQDLGYDGPPFGWDEVRRALLRAELDAFYARAYGLDRDELRYILDPSDVKGPDYPSETFRVLKDKEIRHHGEYRTRRLVLEAWDRMMSEGIFESLGLGMEGGEHQQAVYNDSGQEWKLPASARAPLPLSYQYVVSIMTEMLLQSGNLISWEGLCAATDLLKDRVKLAQLSKPIIGAIVEDWLALDGDRFDATQRFAQLSGLCQLGRMEVIQVDDELVVRLLTREGHPDFPHVRFDARLALVVSKQQDFVRTTPPDHAERIKIATLART